MKKITLVLTLIFSISILNVSCFEDLFGERDDETTSTSSSNTNERPGYDYSFTCPGGTKSSVPIPKGSEKCQKAQEYFARTYGCNDADNFNTANCRVCNDCNWQNYCSVCN